MKKLGHGAQVHLLESNEALDGSSRAVELQSKGFRIIEKFISLPVYLNLLLGDILQTRMILREESDPGVGPFVHFL